MDVKELQDILENSEDGTFKIRFTPHASAAYGNYYSVEFDGRYAVGHTLEQAITNWQMESGKHNG